MCVMCLQLLNARNANLEKNVSPQESEDEEEEEERLTFREKINPRLCWQRRKERKAKKKKRKEKKGKYSSTSRLLMCR